MTSLNNWEEKVREDWSKELEEQDYDSLIKSERYIADWWIKRIHESIQAAEKRGREEVVKGITKLRKEMPDEDIFDTWRYEELLKSWTLNPQGDNQEK